MTLTAAQQRTAAKQFARDWANRGDEKQETQTFWLSLLQDVFGVADRGYISFELPVKLDHVSFIDGYIPATRVLIEQKGRDIDLRNGIKQSDGSLLTPFQQARRYAGYLPHDMNPRWIVVCNFAEFDIHDMNRPNDPPEKVMLADLEKEYHRLNFLVDTGDEHIKKEMEVSLQAGEIVGALYDALLKQYKDPESPETLKSLNALCVRLVFCLYAEDAGIFGGKSMFHDYLRRYDVRDVRKALIDLFRVLDTKPEDRDPYMDEELAAFPYVNGGLFSDESIVIPRLNEEIVNLILHRASEGFDWSAISPTIFGAVFESTLNPETRRSGGMHYTSIANIHKVIDPLFLDALKDELAGIEAITVEKTRMQRLHAFQDKLAALTFLDPAAGSGNFLTETYLSLRRLENRVLSLLYKGQVTIGAALEPIKVSIGQFYGIEINDFAVTVARTALWIAESQMMKETEDVVHMNLDFLPLKTSAHIVEANALRIDWENVVPKSALSYIMGNPPFVGASMMNREQKDEIVKLFGKIKLANSIDYVGAWYYKAAQLMQGLNIHAALVSTNSITQGEQVAPIWQTLMGKFNVHIDFAYRTFRWDSEASVKAHVHCVIIGFSCMDSSEPRRLYSDGNMKLADNISPYLLDADNVIVCSQSKPICDVPPMLLGNKPADGGNMILTEEDKEHILKAEPQLEKFIRPYVGAVEFINNKVRYCLWLVDVTPEEIRKSPELTRRLRAVRQMRLNSSAAPTRQKADTPNLFFFISQPESNYLLIPSTSSENRRYIPIGFLPPDVIASNAATIVADATLYHFGVITSNVHMAWMRTVGGRLKSDYRYSNSIVYNTFPWPTPSLEQEAKIEATGQAILNARALYPDSSLASLYDETTMPPELRKAHQANDRAVMQAYGFPVGKMDESACVAALMQMYQKLTSA